MRVSTTDLQNAFGKYLALVEKEDIIVLKNGKSVAKLSKHTDLEHFIVHEEAQNYKTFRKISYQEYEELVESSDQRYELIGGEIYLLAAPSFKHQVAVTEMFWHLCNYFRGNPCKVLTSPFDVRLFGVATKFEEDPNVVQPDLVVICDQDKVGADGKYRGIPTLVVEVLSPSTKGKDRATKLQLYMKSGVQEYWIVDLESKTVLLYTFTPERDIDVVATYGEDETVQSYAFRGLELPVAAIFTS